MECSSHHNHVKDVCRWLWISLAASSARIVPPPIPNPQSLLHPQSPARARIALDPFPYLGIGLTVALLGREGGLSKSVNEVPTITCSDPRQILGARSAVASRDGSPIGAGKSRSRRPQSPPRRMKPTFSLRRNVELCPPSDSPSGHCSSKLSIPGRRYADLSLEGFTKGHS